MLTRVVTLVLLESLLSGLSANDHITQKSAMYLPSGREEVIGLVDTTFSCTDRPYGYYADVQNDCKIYHVCYPRVGESGDGIMQQFSFFCPKYTIFDQQLLVCAHSYLALPCRSAPDYYALRRVSGTTISVETATKQKKNNKSDVNFVKLFHPSINSSYTENSNNHNDLYRGSTLKNSNVNFFPTDPPNIANDKRNYFGASSETIFDIQLTNNNYGQQQSSEVSTTDQTNAEEHIDIPTDFVEEVYQNFPLTHTNFDEDHIIEKPIDESTALDQAGNEEWIDTTSGNGKQLDISGQYPVKVSNIILSQRHPSHDVVSTSEKVNVNKESDFANVLTNPDISTHSTLKERLVNITIEGEKSLEEKLFSIPLTSSIKIVATENPTAATQSALSLREEIIGTTNAPIVTSKTLTASKYSTKQEDIDIPLFDKNDKSNESTLDRQHLNNSLAGKVIDEQWNTYNQGKNNNEIDLTISETEFINKLPITTKTFFSKSTEMENFSGDMTHHRPLMPENNTSLSNTSMNDDLVTENVSFHFSSIDEHHSEINGSNNTLVDYGTIQNSSEGYLQENHSYDKQKHLTFPASEQSYNIAITNQDKTVSFLKASTLDIISNEGVPVFINGTSVRATSSVPKETELLSDPHVSKEHPNSEFDPTMTEPDVVARVDSVSEDQTSTVTTEKIPLPQISLQHITNNSFTTMQSTEIAFSKMTKKSSITTNHTVLIETIFTADKTPPNNGTNTEYVGAESENNRNFQTNKSHKEKVIQKNTSNNEQEPLTSHSAKNNSTTLAKDISNKLTAKVKVFERRPTIYFGDISSEITLKAQEALKIPYPYHIIYTVFPSVIYYYPTEDDDSSEFEQNNRDSLKTGNVVFPSHVIYPLFQRNGYTYPSPPDK